MLRDIASLFSLKCASRSAMEKCESASPWVPDRDAPPRARSRAGMTDVEGDHAGQHAGRHMPGSPDGVTRRCRWRDANE
jgi:hypothetical protein